MAEVLKGDVCADETSGGKTVVERPGVTKGFKWVEAVDTADDGFMVASDVAHNYTAPAWVLDELSTREGLHEIAATNPNARPELKDQAPIGSFSRNSIDRYLEQRNATLTERRQLASLYEHGVHPGGPLLGTVWALILGQSISSEEEYQHPAQRRESSSTFESASRRNRFTRHMPSR